MSAGVVELVHFRLKPGVTDEAFLAAAEAASGFLKRRAGFVRRHLSKQDDGVWVDHVEWTDRVSALAAADAFAGAPETAPFNSAIDRATTSMKHNALMLKTG